MSKVHKNHQLEELPVSKAGTIHPGKHRTLRSIEFQISNELFLV
jgi:hypothetical protein